jgi:hypothetical protein
MRRIRDGAVFGWRSKGACFPIGAAEHLDVYNHSNYFLPETVGPDSAGALALSAGDEYQLTIETEGAVLQGRATIPEEFSIAITDAQGTRKLVWPRVRGAGGYSVRVIADGNASQPVLQTDTTFWLNVSRGHAIVTALDDNLFAYQIDKQRKRAGIEPGFGVFGAMKSSDISF